MKNNIELEKVFVELIHEYERVIYKVCSFYVSEEFPLSDLYQEIVCNLWIAYPKFRGECSLSTWIYRIALNSCISGLRKTKNHPKKISVFTVPDIISEPRDINTDFHLQELYKLISQLKTVERSIILLYLEEKTYQEISDITGLSLSNVAVKLKRTKEKLKQMSNL